MVTIDELRQKAARSRRTTALVPSPVQPADEPKLRTITTRTQGIGYGTIRGSVERFSVDEVIAALRNNYGTIAATARQLHCNRNTVIRYIHMHDVVNDVYMELMESVTRQARINIAESIMTRDEDSVSNSKWWVARKAPDLAPPRQEITGAEGGPITFQVVYEKSRIIEGLAYEILDEQKD